jgi:hypothetical protein
LPKFFFPKSLDLGTSLAILIRFLFETGAGLTDLAEVLGFSNLFKSILSPTVFKPVNFLY